MTPKEEFLQTSKSVEGFVTLMRGSRSELAAVFANDDALVRGFLSNVEQAAAAYRRAQELWASGQQAEALADIRRTLRLVDRLRELVRRGAEATQYRSWAEHLALSPGGRSLTGATGDVIGSVGDGLGAIVDGIGDGLKGLGSGLGTVAKVVIVVVVVAGAAFGVRALAS